MRKYWGSLLGAFAVLAMLIAPASATAAASDVPDIVWPPKDTKPVHWTSEQLWQRSAELQGVLEQTFPAAAPQAMDVNVDAPQSDTGGNFDGQQYMAAFITFRDQIGTTGVAATFYAPGQIKAAPKQQCEGPDVLSCEGRMLPDGSVELDVLAKASKDGKRKLASVERYYPNGAMTRFTSYNYDPIFDGDEGPMRKPVAVPFDQLHKLGRAAGLNFVG